MKENRRKEPPLPMPWELAGTEKTAPVLLALSGGADSRFLLDRLAKGAARDGFPLLLAHVHHGIRGETADRDRDFCRSLAARYGLPIEIMEADVPALAKASGRGIEEEARATRYAFFARLMRERSIPLLATAHQADDLLETMLFRLARGTGAGGLAGIPPVRRIAEGWLVRPLLEWTAAEIRAACRREGLDYVEDETNADSAYARNRIRHEAVPALASIYPAPQKQAVRLAERLRIDEDYFSRETDRFLEERSPAGPDCAALLALHPAVRSRVLAKWIAEKTGTAANAATLARAENLLAGPNGRRVSVSGTAALVKRAGRLSVVPKAPAPADFRVPLCEGKTLLPSGITVVVRVGGETTRAYDPASETTLCFAPDPAMLDRGLFWRGRAAGDLVFVRGHHRRLRRLLWGLQNDGLALGPAGGADDLGMGPLAGDINRNIRLGCRLHDGMDAGHEGTGGVHGADAALFARRHDCLGERVLAALLKRTCDPEEPVFRRVHIFLAASACQVFRGTLLSL